MKRTDMVHEEPKMTQAYLYGVAYSFAQLQPKVRADMAIPFAPESEEMVTTHGANLEAAAKYRR